jgi:hypothetical protein
MGKITRLFRGLLSFLILIAAPGLWASEADINIPDLSQVSFNGLGGMSGATLMYIGLVICVVGAIFGLVQYVQRLARPTCSRRVGSSPSSGC